MNLDDIAAGDGDLTHRLPVSSNDELGNLANSFNLFVEKFHSLVRQITEMTEQLTTLVEDMSAQAQRSEQAMNRQRQETDQVATAIHEMSTAAQQVQAGDSPLGRPAEVARPGAELARLQKPSNRIRRIPTNKSAQNALRILFYLWAGQQLLIYCHLISPTSHQPPMEVTTVSFIESIFGTH